MTQTAQAPEAKEAKKSLLDRLQEVDLTASRGKEYEYEPVQRGEKVIGALSDYLQRLNIIRIGLIMQKNDKEASLNKMVDDHLEMHLNEKSEGHSCEEFGDKGEVLAKELHHALREVELVDIVFRSTLYLEFFDFPSEEIDIREGNRVVLVNRSRNLPERLEELLGVIFGERSIRTR